MSYFEVINPLHELYLIKKYVTVDINLVSVLEGWVKYCNIFFNLHRTNHFRYYSTTLLHLLTSSSRVLYHKQCTKRILNRKIKLFKLNLTLFEVIVKKTKK